MSVVTKDVIPGPVPALMPMSNGGREASGMHAETTTAPVVPLLTKRVGVGRARSLPYVMDTEIGRQSPGRLKVRPEVFVGLIDRLDHPMIAHYQRPLGAHVYTVQCGAFVVQTRSTGKLSFLDASDQQMNVSYQKLESGLKEQAMSVQQRDLPEDEGVVYRTEPLMEVQTGDGYFVTEWWNSMQDPALSVARLRIEPGVSTRPYQLHGITERYLFLSGTGFVEIDGEVQTVGPGDGMLIKPGAWRSVTNKGLRDLGWLAICRPRFSRLDPNFDKSKFVKQR